MLELFSFLEYGFMQRALAAGLVVGLLAPSIGTFLVVRRYALLFDTLSHVALAGVAVGLLTQSEPVWAAVILTVLGAVGMEWLRATGRLQGEAVLAIFLSGSLAVAVVLMSLADSINTDLFSYLFGSITTVSSTDVWTISILGVVVLLLLSILYRRLYLVALDERLAYAAGHRVQAMNYLVVIIGAVTVALSMRIVGALLIGALMVIPVMAAVLRRTSFVRTLLLAVCISVVSVLVGLLSSYHFDIASGGSIVVSALLLFLISFLTRTQR